MAAIVVTLDGRVLDGAVHPLDLTIRPRAPRLGQAVLDTMLLAGLREGVEAIEAGLLTRCPDRLGFGLSLLVDWHGVDELGALRGLLAAPAAQIGSMVF